MSERHPHAGERDLRTARQSVKNRMYSLRPSAASVRAGSDTPEHATHVMQTVPLPVQDSSQRFPAVTPRHPVRIGGQTIAFQRAAPKQLRAKSPIASIVISALRSLGRNRVDDKIIEHLRHRLSSPERKVLLRDARYSEDWILEAVKKITTEKHGTDG